jgi:hypothetical protein
MHINSRLTIQRDDNAFQAPYVLCMVYGHFNRYLVASKKASLEYVDCSCNRLSFQGRPASIL